MIERPNYLEKLKPLIDVKIVKILSGIRRCGKSTILGMLKDYLLSKGINNDHIININYSNEDLDNYSAASMYADLKSKILDENKYYLLLDELQEISGWEKVVNTFLETYNTDIYITGSNSKLMSSEISTYLTGRYVDIPVYPLSFKEYLSFKNDPTKSNKDHLFDYIRYGGFPLVAINDFDENTVYNIVEDIYNSVVIKDIVDKKKILNIDLFDRVVKFIIENIGKTFSANSIFNFLKSEHRTVPIENIYNYLEWLEKAFVIYRCKRYDLQGKSVLKTQEKFYIADSSIKYALLGFNPTSIASMLENIIYFELKRRGYEVYIGKNSTKEIDFIAIMRNDKMYIQVCRSMPTESDREIQNLLEIKDQFPKIIITLDDFAYGNVEGVQIINLIDFLLND